MSNQLLNQFQHMPKKDMSSGLKLVLMYLCNMGNKETNIAFPSIATIAKDLNLSAKQVRRHTHELEKRGLLRIVENRFGGKKGMTCRYKLILPPAPTKNISTFEKITTPANVHHCGHPRSYTTPSYGSQTVVKPFITIKDINKKFGFGWSKDSDTACRVGKFIGLEAYRGEDNYAFVGRIYSKLNNEQVQSAYR